MISGHIHSYLSHLPQTICCSVGHRSKEKRLDGSDSSGTEGAPLARAPAPAFWRGCIHHATPPANPEHSKSICHISKSMAFSNSLFSLCLLLSEPLKCRRGTFSGFSQESETPAFIFFLTFFFFFLFFNGSWGTHGNFWLPGTLRKTSNLVRLTVRATAWSLHAS